MKTAFQQRTVGLLALCAAMVGPLSLCYADGLPGEYLLSSRWRDLLGQHSPLTNAAFLADENFITVRGAYAPVLQGAFRLWEAGVTVPVGLRQSFGASFIGENDAKISSSTMDDASGRLVADGGSSSNNNVFTMLTYAVKPWGRLSLGANLNIAYQSNFGEPLMGTGLDIGCSYRLLTHPKFGDHTVGLSTVNLLSPSMSSSMVPRFGTAGEYSRALRLSWLATFWEQRLESGLDIDLKDILANADKVQNKKIEWLGAWRLGARILPVLPVYAQLGFGRDVIDYWGLAGGISVPLANDAGKVTVLYQYNLKTEGDAASAHTIYLLMNIGKHRKGPETVSKQQPQAQQLRQESGLSSGSAELDSLRKIEGITIEQDSAAVKITAAEVAVHFKSGSSNLPDEARRALGEIARFLKTYPDHSVSIEGHTDSDPITGQLASIYPDNKALSKARAEKVKEYFVVTEKLPDHLFTTVGWGESKPLASNDTKEGKSRNRRVVIIVKTQ